MISSMVRLCCSDFDVVISLDLVSSRSSLVRESAAMRTAGIPVAFYRATVDIWAASLPLLAQKFVLEVAHYTSVQEWAAVMNVRCHRPTCALLSSTNPSLLPTTLCTSQCKSSYRYHAKQVQFTCCDRVVNLHQGIYGQSSQNASYPASWWWYIPGPFNEQKFWTNEQ